MRVLLAIDGSSCSDVALQAVAAHAWAAPTEIEIVAVAHTRIPFLPDPIGFMTALHETALDDAREDAAAQLRRAEHYLAGLLPGATLATTMLEGSPAREISAEAGRWHADLVVVGAHRRSRIGRWLHRSVSHAVATHAPCRVDVVTSST